MEPTSELLAAILDSLADPVTFMDKDHVIRYMNRAALTHNPENAARIDTSLMDCHNEQSQQIIRRIAAELEAGTEEVLYSERPEVRLYMRAIRDAGGRYLGYIERRERIGT